MGEVKQPGLLTIAGVGFLAGGALTIGAPRDSKDRADLGRGSLGGSWGKNTMGKDMGKERKFHEDRFSRWSFVAGTIFTLQDEHSIFFFLQNDPKFGSE